MYILGISCFYHDAAAALLKDGVLVAASEEERFSRRKHDFGYPHHAIEFCLRMAGITAQDLDYVVFYEKPLQKFERLLLSHLQGYPYAAGVFARAMNTWLSDKFWISGSIQDHLGIPESKLLFCDHHLSHAASAFLCSPYEDAALLTMDGVGAWTTTSIGHASARWQGEGLNALTLTREIRFPHSLGLLYSVFTAFLGFEVNEGEYKVMGMAPYGTPRYRDKVDRVFQRHRDGSFTLDMDYFAFHTSHARAFNHRFESVFGAPRVPESDFYTERSGLPDHYDVQTLTSNTYYADVAASIQSVTEDAMVALAQAAYDATQSPRLCIAGGVAYNCLGNTRILKETDFTDIYIQPAAGDSGGALGAALYVHNIVLQQPRIFTMTHAYWGAQYTPDAVQQALDRAGVTYRRYNSEQALLDVVADHMMEGKVVGWSQDRCEWGPRALGNRSIIADPRRADMKGTVNAKIKFREPFRPFAPSIIRQAVTDYVDLPAGAAEQYPPQFMLYVTDVKEDKQNQIPACCHMGTARLQAVDKETNPRYHQLINTFADRSGIPVILNTSFNLRGEPLVNAPEHALWTFANSGIDVLALEGQFLVHKKGD
jgi:carbamoyltransferase